MKDYKIPINKELNAFEFNEKFICPSCSREYFYLDSLQSLNTKKQKIIDEIKAYTFFIIIGLLILFFFIKPVISNVIHDYQTDRDTITNKEYEEFQEWEKKQVQNELENKVIIDNRE